MMTMASGEDSRGAAHELGREHRNHLATASLGRQLRIAQGRWQCEAGPCLGVTFQASGGHRSV
jgi:hypothetical protein